jgi:MFS family permease
MKLNYARNIPLLYIYSVLIKRVSMPIIVIYFLFNNLNYTQIGILAAVTSIIHLSTEVHGGIFADLKGKRTSLILHSIFGIFTMLLYFIGNSFPWFLMASITYGISGSFISGTRNALLYDSLKQLDRTSEFKKFNGKVLLYSHTINALILLAVPFIYTYNNKLPFLIGVGFFIASLITALYFVEPPMTRKSQSTLAMYNSKFIEALKEVKLSKKLLSAILMAMVTAAFVYMSAPFMQPLMQIAGLPIIYFGVVYAFMRAIMGLGGVITHKMEKYLSLEKLLFIGAGIMVVSFLGFSLGAGIVIIISLILMKLASGYNRIILDDEINKNIKSKNRTTVLSISSLFQQLMNAGLIFIFGIVADQIGIQNMFYYALALFLVCIIAALFFMRKTNGKLISI